jgi:hypothetical protein
MAQTGDGKEIPSVEACIKTTDRKTGLVAERWTGSKQYTTL